MSFMKYWSAFRTWISGQWNNGNRGGAILTVATIVVVLWWALRVLWVYVFIGVLFWVGFKLYRRYMNGPTPPQVRQTPPSGRVTTMPQTANSKNTTFSSPSTPTTNIRIPMRVSMRIIGIVAGIIIAAVIVGRFLIVIPAGTVGVYELFGKVSPNEISSGLHFVNPLGQVEKMSIRTEQYTMSVAQEEGVKKGDDSIDALTKEGLQLQLDITVLYSLQKDKASDVYLQLGSDFAQKVIRPEIRSAIREVAARYDANAVYSEKRTEMTEKIHESLASSLNTRGINVEDVLLRNVSLPAKLSDSIQEKLQADQEAQRYEFVLQKESKEAERKRIEAAGQRDAQKIIADGLTPNYLNYLYIQNLKDNKGTIYVPTSATTGLPLFKSVGQ